MWRRGDDFEVTTDVQDAQSPDSQTHEDEKQADAQTLALEVVCPEGVQEGDEITVMSPRGEVAVAVPVGVAAGETFSIEIGAEPAAEDEEGEGAAAAAAEEEEEEEEEEDDDALDILEDFAAEDTEAEVEPAAESEAQKRQAAEDAVSGDSVFGALSGLLGGDDQPGSDSGSDDEADPETDDILAELEAGLGRTSAEIAEDSSSTTMTIPCPEGVSAGEVIDVTTEDGQELTVEVPEGVQAGDEFDIEIQ